MERRLCDMAWYVDSGFCCRWNSFSNYTVSIMEDVNLNNLSLQQKLTREMRICPTCSLEITNPFTERCPRCFTLLPKLSLNCQGCIHQLLCPVAQFSKVE
jgi:hypothetical protein